MHILQIITHSPSSCPLGNPKNLEIKMKWFENIDAIAGKYGIKVLGIWTDRWGHASWAVFETPSMEAFKKFELEPINLARVTFTDIKTTVVTDAKDTLAFFKDYQEQNPLGLSLPKVETNKGTS
jgi:hypothetical protein